MRDWDGEMIAGIWLGLLFTGFILWAIVVGTQAINHSRWKEDVCIRRGGIITDVSNNHEVCAVTHISYEYK